MTVEGVVRVYRIGPPVLRRVIVCVWVDDPAAPADLDGSAAWMVQAPARRTHWPSHRAASGHRVRVAATFRPFPVGARAYRAQVECADEAEHALAALAGLGRR